MKGLKHVDRSTIFVNCVACLSCRHARDIRMHYEEKLERANSLYRELNTCMEQLDLREKELMRCVTHKHSLNIFAWLPQCVSWLSSSPSSLPPLIFHLLYVILSSTMIPSPSNLSLLHYDHHHKSTGSKGGVVMKALASHHCKPGTGLGVVCEWSC